MRCLHNGQPWRVLPIQQEQRNHWLLRVLRWRRFVRARKEIDQHHGHTSHWLLALKPKKTCKGHNQQTDSYVEPQRLHSWREKETPTANLLRTSSNVMAWRMVDQAYHYRWRYRQWNAQASRHVERWSADVFSVGDNVNDRNERLQLSRSYNRDYADCCPAFPKQARQHTRPWTSRQTRRRVHSRNDRGV